jgi:hypothetical protein
VVYFISTKEKKMADNKQQTVLTPPVEQKSNRLRTVLMVFGLVLLVTFIGYIIISYTPAPLNPMAQFITQKQCDFLAMPDMNRAVCTDGSVYDVVQIGSPQSPLP